jgi:hypothetical protein
MWNNPLIEHHFFCSFSQGTHRSAAAEQIKNDGAKAQKRNLCDH